MRPLFWRLELLLIATLVLAFMIHMTGLAQAATPLAVPTAMAIEYGVVAIFCLIALARGHVFVLLACFAWIAYLILQCFVWNQITGLPMNTNSILSYGTLVFFIVFYETRVRLETILYIVLSFTVTYLAIYSLFWKNILDLVGQGSNVYLPSDGERGARLYLAAPFATFVFMYGLVSFRRQPLLSIPLLAMSGYALFIAQTRFATILLLVAILAAVVGSIAGELRKTANVGLAVIFLAACSLSLAGFLVPNWNPYEVVSGDASGNARTMQYRDAINALGDHLPTGLGIAGGTQDVQFYLRPSRPFFASDLGISGILVEFGLPFAILTVLACVLFIVRPVRPFAQMDRMSMTLFYVTQQSAFGTVFANTLIGGAATLFGAITLALWLQRDQPVLPLETLEENSFRTAIAAYPGNRGAPSTK